MEKHLRIDISNKNYILDCHGGLFYPIDFFEIPGNVYVISTQKIGELSYFSFMTPIYYYIKKYGNLYLDRLVNTLNNLGSSQLYQKSKSDISLFDDIDKAIFSTISFLKEGPHKGELILYRQGDYIGNYSLSTDDEEGVEHIININSRTIQSWLSTKYGPDELQIQQLKPNYIKSFNKLGLYKINNKSIDYLDSYKNKFRQCPYYTLKELIEDLKTSSKPTKYNPMILITNFCKGLDTCAPLPISQKIATSPLRKSKSFKIFENIAKEKLKEEQELSDYEQQEGPKQFKALMQKKAKEQQQRQRFLQYQRERLRQKKAKELQERRMRRIIRSRELRNKDKDTSIRYSPY